jgi:glyoxylase-like metal-dependent hydrolase (beta-lactamase superfamily II)
MILAGLAAGQALAAAAASAQTLDEIAKAMGADKVETIQYLGTGSFYAVGQSYRPGVPWPRFNLVKASRHFDYAKGAYVGDITLTQAENPPRGGGTQPVIGEQRRMAGVAGERAWMLAGAFTLAAPAQIAPLQHDLWTSPHGLIKAAIADKVQPVKAPGGSTLTLARAGKWKAKATLDAQHRVVKVESWIDIPVLGDMAVVTTYGGYRSVDSVPVPGTIVQTAGGHKVLDMKIAEVKINAGSPAVPTAINPPAGEVKTDKAADGVFFIHGATHHSVAIEMKDHIILVEGPLGDARELAAIAAAKQAIPGKPIKYVINTHHHFDHSGGLRAFVAEGAAIVTHAINVDYFRAAYAAPRTLNPDAAAKSGKKPVFLGVGAKHVLGDGQRRVEIHQLAGNSHNDGLLVVLLPKEKVLIVADAFSPREPITKRPDALNPFTTNLWANIQQKKLAVETIVPIHGRMVKVNELMLAAGAAPTN